jgi:predicted MFS family arabinose efflux permease
MQQQQSSIGLATGGLLAMAAAIGIGRFVYTPILPVMLESLGWNKAAAGLVASSNFLGYLIGALLAARPIAVSFQRRGLITALLVSAMMTLGMAVQSHIAILMVLRLLGGAASAFVIVLASTLVLARLSAAGRGPLSAIHFAGVGAGIMVSAALVSALLAAGAGWQALWIWSGAAAFVATGLVALLIPDQTLVTTGPAAPSAAHSPHGLPMLIIAYGLFGFGYVITATFLVTSVRMSPELRELETWIWVLFGFAAVPSVALWSWIGVRLGAMTAFALACLVEALGVAASVEWVTVSGICLAAVLLGGTFMGITALGLVAGRQLSSGNPQRVIGLMTASFAFGQMIGPTAAGYLFDSLGSLRVPSLVAAGALVVAAGLAIVAGRAVTARAPNRTSVDTEAKP